MYELTAWSYGRLDGIRGWGGDYLVVFSTDVL